MDLCNRRAKMTGLIRGKGDVALMRGGQTLSFTHAS